MMAQVVLDEGIDSDGRPALRGEPDGHFDTDKHWWPQAEAVVGFLNAYGLSGQQHFLDAAERSWDFIEKTIVDREYGEWFWKVSREGVPDPNKTKSAPGNAPTTTAAPALR